MYHGIINIYKEAGFTSHDVVAKLRGICKQKRIGHTGTLDPDAVGVLPVCMGNATRLCDMLTDRTKEYVTVLRLGITTDTQDITGQVQKESDIMASLEKIREVIMSFRGDQMQIPPMYSALKVNGQKLYQLARQGIEIEREARPITVSSIEILEENGAEYKLRINCSKGTYIRTLCNDIGEKLGCGGTMVSLCRTRVGEFKLENAITLAEAEQLVKHNEFDKVVIPVEKMFANLQKLTVREDFFKALKNGNQLKPEECITKEGRDGEEFRVYSYEGCFYGIYRFDDNRQIFTPVKLFLPEQ